MWTSLAALQSSRESIKGADILIEINDLQVDQSDDAALEYADHLAEILNKKAAMTAALQKRLASFQRVLRQSH